MEEFVLDTNPENISETYGFISAEIHDQGFQWQFRFNIAPWFHQASLTQIREQLDREYVVETEQVLFMAHWYPEVASRIAEPGAECTLAEADLVGWLKKRGLRLELD